MGSEDDEEIPLDQLMGSDEEGIPEEEEIPPEQVGQEQVNEPNNLLQAEKHVNQELPELPAPEMPNQALPKANELLQAMVADNFHQMQPEPQHSNIQLGFALLRTEERDPAWSQAMNAEATKLWARFFSVGNSSNIQISIPAAWANFFTVILLNPGNFNWVKQLLSSYSFLPR